MIKSLYRSGPDVFARDRAPRPLNTSICIGYERGWAQIAYILKRLRTHGLIKKVAHTYKYYLTTLGRRVLVTALVIREYFVQPTLVRIAL